MTHRPAIRAVRDAFGWCYQARCSCGARTHPLVVLPWGMAMYQAMVHLHQESRRDEWIDGQVAAFRDQLDGSF